MCRVPNIRHANDRLRWSKPWPVFLHMSIFSELKRRNVFRVSVAYFAADKFLLSKPQPAATTAGTSEEIAETSAPVCRLRKHGFDGLQQSLPMFFILEGQPLYEPDGIEPGKLIT